MSPAEVKRAANEILRRSSDTSAWPLPYFCECDDMTCLQAIWLDPDEYDRLRPRGPLLSERVQAA